MMWRGGGRETRYPPLFKKNNKEGACPEEEEKTSPGVKILLLYVYGSAGLYLAVHVFYRSDGWYCNGILGLQSEQRMVRLSVGRFEMV